MFKIKIPVQLCSKFKLAISVQNCFKIIENSSTIRFVKKRVQALKKQAPIRHALTLLLPKAKEESRICITGCAEACLFTFFYIG